MAKQSNRAPARKQGSPKNNPAPKTKKVPVREDPAPGSVLLKLALILCTALVVFSLMFASVNGGSKYVGLPEEDTKTTPTPPVTVIDPALNVSGSEITPPPPPSETPGVDAPVDGGEAPTP